MNLDPQRGRHLIWKTGRIHHHFDLLMTPRYFSFIPKIENLFPKTILLLFKQFNFISVKIPLFRFFFLFRSQFLNENSQCLRLLCNHLIFFFCFSRFHLFNVCIAQIDFFLFLTRTRDLLLYTRIYFYGNGKYLHK